MMARGTAACLAPKRAQLFTSGGACLVAEHLATDHREGREAA